MHVYHSNGRAGRGLEFRYFTVSDFSNLKFLEASEIDTYGICVLKEGHLIRDSKMEKDKENSNHLHSKTRIPLPLLPLPALPLRIIQKGNNQNLKKEANHLNRIQSETKIQRQPLQTLSHQNFSVPGPSHGNAKRKSLTLDTRHVTLRQRSEDLDWDYNVFKDDKEDTSVITISDDENIEGNCKGLNYFVENKQCNCLGIGKMAVTPAFKSPTLENSRIRNIKKSLKRPHSRELQGLTPAKKHDKKDGDKDVRRLKINESLQDRLDSPDFLQRSYMTCLTRDYTTDIYDYLLITERKPLEIPRIRTVSRACLINWVIKLNGADGNPAVVQTACWYLDSVLGTGHVELDMLQLVAAACFWIAQKLHGPYMSASRLVTYANHAFTCKRLLSAERAVLARLKFPPQPAVPQDFINYLAWWCDNDHPGEIEVAATFLCMAGLMVDKALCEEFPSVIAAAAVRNALLLYKGRNQILRLQMCPVYTSAEKKAVHFSRTCSILRRAVRTMAAADYEYKAPYEHYGIPPHHIAQKVVNAAFNLTFSESRNVLRKELF